VNVRAYVDPRRWVSAWVTLAVAAGAACARAPGDGAVSLPPHHPPLVAEAQATAALPPCPEDETGRVYLGLRPSCVGCHGAGANQAFFASEAAFRALLVSNPAFVRPGDPAGSLLVQLLRGTAAGPYRQMPTAGAAYADLPGIPISMAEVERWITGLSATPRSRAPNPDAPTTRPLRAEELVASLQDQLGLEDADFVRTDSRNYDSPTATFRGDLAVYSPDRAARPHYDHDALATSTRWRALGGPGWLAGVRRGRAITPALMQTLRQLSYAWCRMAVQKPGNTVMFQRARPTDRVATAEAAIRADLASMVLRMLGDPASPAEVDGLMTEVFVPLEAQGGPEVAWTGACAALAQDPRWLAW
jgi:hypothetical protein